MDGLVGLVSGLVGLVGRLVFGLVGGLVGLISGLRVVGLGVTVVGDVGNVAGVAIDVVVDVLLAAIGKNNPVVAGGLVTIASLVLAEVVVVVILHSPVELVVSRGLFSKQIEST